MRGETRRLLGVTRKGRARFVQPALQLPEIDPAAVRVERQVAVVDLQRVALA